jgi:hypothetical protein
MNRCVMNRNEAVCLEHLKEFIQKVVRIVTNETKQVLDVIEVKVMNFPLNRSSWLDNIASVSPKPPDTIECAV